MTSRANSLGKFIAELMHKREHNNSSLAQVAGVSESVIRNLLKHGEKDSKDPDPRTLRRVADALDIDSLLLFRLAGYISSRGMAHSPRGDYLAEVFDELPPEKQDAVMGVVEAMSEVKQKKEVIRQMRDDASNPLAGFDLASPRVIRTLANTLISQYQMTDPNEAERIQEDTQVLHYNWNALPSATKQRVKALIRHKLSLEYDPMMVELEWRE